MKPAMLDRMLLGGGVIILVGTLAWALTSLGDPTFTVVAARSGQVGDRSWTPVTTAAVDPQVLDWPPPAAQSRGERWIFEAFTPPIIYFNPTTQAFTVEPPLPPSAAPVEPPFGISVVAVERELYRLQLEGYLVGPVGNVYLLNNVETGEGVRLREGQSAPEAAVTLVSGRIERRVVPSDDASQTPTSIEVVTVALRDERLGEGLELTNLSPRYNPRIQARLQLEDGTAVTAGEGESVAGPAGQFIIRRIDLENQRVTVEKLSTGAESVVRELSPGAAP